MAVNYVKFQRGSQAAYDALLKAGRVDENTLYFIYPGDNSGTGKLYLGERIISGGEVVLTAAKLDDLADVITTNVGANDFLVYDGENWVSKTLTQVTELIKSSIDLSAYAKTADVEKAIEDAIADIPTTDLSDYAKTTEVNQAIENAIATIPEVTIPDITASDDGVINLTAEGHTISAEHAKNGPIDGATKGATADAELNAFGSSIEFKVPTLTVDEYGHTTEIDEKTIKISVPTLNDENTQYELKYETDENNNKVIRLYTTDNEIVSTIDASDFIKDGMLADVEYDANSNTLTFVWNTDSGMEANTVTLNDILDPYTAGALIEINGTEISHKVVAAPVGTLDESGARKYLTNIITDNYGHITGYKFSEETVQDTNTKYALSVNTPDNVDNTVNIVLTSDEPNAHPDLIPVKGAELINVTNNNSNIIISTPGLGNGLKVDNDKIVLDLGAGLGIDNDKKLSVLVPVDGHIVVNNSNELTVGTLPVYELATIEGKEVKTLVTPGTGIFKDVYTKEETNDAIADAVKVATGGESASDVLIELNNYKKKVNLEVWGDESGSGATVNDQTNQSRIDILQSAIGDLSKLIRDESRENTTLVDEINYINERLTWGEMTE